MTNEVRITDPVTGGQKGSKPERFDLVPWDAMEEVARVYGFGATKYEDHNWLRGYKWSLSIASAFRHLVAMVLGQDRDPESGCLHTAHLAWHALTLTTFILRKLGTDDRYRALASLPATLAVWKPEVGKRARIKPSAGLYHAGLEGELFPAYTWLGYDFHIRINGNDVAVSASELEPPQGWAP